MSNMLDVIRFNDSRNDLIIINDAYFTALDFKPSAGITANANPIPFLTPRLPV
jgi:hypothetical protein